MTNNNLKITESDTRAVSLVILQVFVFAHVDKHAHLPFSRVDTGEAQTQLKWSFF